MKFIRKNGRIIPIKDKEETLQITRKAGRVGAAVGALVSTPHAFNLATDLGKKFKNIGRASLFVGAASIAGYATGASYGFMADMLSKLKKKRQLNFTDADMDAYYRKKTERRKKL
jgi:hypothetical protein